MTRVQQLVGGIALVAAFAIPFDANAQCATNADCRVGRICSKSGKCVDQPCSKDIDCPNNGACDAGVCKAAVAPPVAPQAPAPSPPPAPAAAPAVPEYRTESRRIPGLYVTGPVVLGATWLLTIAVTAAATASDDPLFGQKVGESCVPVAGPWLLLGTSGTSAYAAPLVVSGVLQAAGLGVMIAGLAVRHDVRVPTSSIASFSIVPTIGGAAGVGTF